MRAVLAIEPCTWVRHKITRDHKPSKFLPIFLFNYSDSLSRSALGPWFGPKNDNDDGILQLWLTLPKNSHRKKIMKLSLALMVHLHSCQRYYWQQHFVKNRMYVTIRGYLKHLMSFWIYISTGYSGMFTGVGSNYFSDFARIFRIGTMHEPLCWCRYSISSEINVENLISSKIRKSSSINICQ